jgi:hypothetical protein
MRDPACWARELTVPPTMLACADDVIEWMAECQLLADFVAEVG